MWGRISFMQVLIFTMTIVFASCVPESGGTRSNGQFFSSDTSSNDNTDADTDTEIETAPPLVELRHIVDPYDGNYKTKVTIPKNYEGILFIAGLNLSRLKDGEDYFVRFRFGRNRTSFVRPAWVFPTAIPGLNVTSFINVLAVDLNGSPFEGLRLTNYHLYDYNDYATAEEPISDPFDGRLYCRALQLEDDPTFTASGGTSTCSNANDKCLYSYASVWDSTPEVNNGSNVFFPRLPTQLNFSLNNTGFYYNETEDDLMSKCLSDSGDDSIGLDQTQAYSNAASGNVQVGSNFGFTDGTVISGTYRYNGPYEARSEASWEISGDAVIGRYGLFLDQLVAGTNDSGIYSLKFPRAGRLPIKKDIEYIGEDTSPLVPRVDDNNTPSDLTDDFNLVPGPRNFDGPLSTNAIETSLMDGCNIRIANYDIVTKEGIDSCDVTALIEVVKLDNTTGAFVVVDGVATNQLKIQLIRRTSRTPLDSTEVVSTAFRSCNSNNECSSSECCYNNRCWSNDIVTQCVDDSSTSQKQDGELCSNDLECKSLCCSPNNGRCAGHDGDDELCGKPVGLPCVADEFCDKVNQVEWNIVRTGTDPNDPNTVTCELRPTNVERFAQCKLSGNVGVCMAPPEPEIPMFDPSNPDCSNAIDPITQSN